MLCSSLKETCISRVIEVDTITRSLQLDNAMLKDPRMTKKRLRNIEPYMLVLCTTEEIHDGIGYQSHLVETKCQRDYKTDQ
jgi:hypothetical protein